MNNKTDFSRVKQLRPWLRIMPVLLFFGFILWIIVMADSGTENILFDLIKSVPQGDKLAHLGLYGLLTVLLNVALNFRALTIKTYPLQWGAVLVLTFALLEEMSQYFFPNRTLDMIDVIADVIGIVLFSYASLRWRNLNWFK
jgi:VanZ family protein